jgi:hypothetical protein
MPGTISYLNHGLKTFDQVANPQSLFFRLAAH